MSWRLLQLNAVYCMPEQRDWSDRSRAEGACGLVRRQRAHTKTMPKRVITISERKLPSVAQALLDLMANDGFFPDALLGIATGGALVVDSFPTELNASRFTCSLQRPSTAAKQRTRAGQRALTKMPYLVTDILRVIEDRVREQSRATVPSPPPGLERSLDLVREEVVKQGLRSIAVVDDAVDSGATLACVMSALKKRLPSNVIVRSAVITQTRKSEKTLTQPDYALYENTLCRFHWSYDYRGTE